MIKANQCTVYIIILSNYCIQDGGFRNTSYVFPSHFVVWAYLTFSFLGKTPVESWDWATVYTEEFVIYWNTDILSKHYHVYHTTNHCRWPDCNWFCCSKLYRLFRPQQFFQITFHAMTAGYSSTVWEDFRLSKWSINEAKSKTCKLCRRVQQVA